MKNLYICVMVTTCSHPADVYIRQAYALASGSLKDTSCFSIVYHSMQGYIFCDMNGFRKLIAIDNKNIRQSIRNSSYVRYPHHHLFRPHMPKPYPLRMNNIYSLKRKVLAAPKNKLRRKWVHICCLYYFITKKVS